MKRSTLGALGLGALLALGLAGCAGKHKEPPPAPAPVQQVFVVKGVHFAFDSARLTPTGESIVDEAAAALKAQPEIAYEVGGHTCSIGTDQYNFGLSERRATTVMNGLLSRGVWPGQLTMRWYGESNPVASNDTEAGRMENRRVEIRPLNR
jgi:OOP family OmpA-OmpF porin